MRGITYATLVAACLATSSAAAAEVKLGFIDSGVIRDRLPEFKNVERQLQRLQQQYEKEGVDRESKLIRLQEDLRKQELLMSESRKAEMQAQIDESILRLQKFVQEKLGPNGELFRKNVELSSPILGRINAAIEAIAKEDGYDFIFDIANSGTIVYVDPERYNVTEKLIERLEKEREEQEKGQ